MPMTFGIIVGNRGFFPDHLARSGREQMIAALTAAGHDVVCPTPEQTKHGAVENRAHAKIVADLFRQNRDRIDGVIVTLPNFGEERAMADALRLADLNVPVLIHAFPDTPDRMLIADRRDSFCGKMSICNNLKQYRIPYSLTTLHTEGLDSDEFKSDLAWFAGVCRVTNGLRRLRIGAIGARPAAFNTVRYSEKLLEMSGITVEPLDLSEGAGRPAGEAPQRRGFVREGLENGVQLGHVQNLGNPALGVEQLDLAALVGDAGVGSHQFAQPGAIHVGHLRQVEQHVDLPLVHQVFDRGAHQSGTLSQSDAARQVYDRDVARVTHSGFAAHC